MSNAIRFPRLTDPRTFGCMCRWLVCLTGKKTDLRRLVDWSIEKDWQIDSHVTWGIVLSGARLETAAQYEDVSRIAEKLVCHINRSAKYRVPEFHGVRRGTIVDQSTEPANQIVPLGIAEERDSARPVRAISRAPDGTVVETTESLAWAKEASGGGRLVSLQKAYPALSDALRYFQEEPGLVGYYKVAEAIRGGFTSNNSWNQVARLCGVSKRELGRFRHSAQIKRHHKIDVPDKPMSEDEARAFTNMLLNRLIDHLDKTPE